MVSEEMKLDNQTAMEARRRIWVVSVSNKKPNRLTILAPFYLSRAHQARQTRILLLSLGSTSGDALRDPLRLCQAGHNIE